MSESSLAGSAHSPLAPGSRTLQGRIEAIGIHELLRLSAIKGSTGMLLVFNNEADAQLYYEQGHLVAATSSSLFGIECLMPVLLMRTGEFEFTEGLSADPAQCTPGLHEAMMRATKEYFEREIRTRRMNRQSAPEEDNLTSGVHRVAAPPPAAPTLPAAPAAAAPPPAPAAAPPSSRTAHAACATPSAVGAPSTTMGTSLVDAPAEPPGSSPSPPALRATTATQAGSPPPLAPSSATRLPASRAGHGADESVGCRARPVIAGELGSATLDSAGHLIQKAGDFSPQDLVVSALALRIAGGLGTLLGEGDLQRLEVHGFGDKALLCDATGETVVSIKVANTAEVESVWEQVRR